VLLVSHDPAGERRHLVRTLESNQFEVTRARRHPRQARRFPARRDQQLGHGIHPAARKAALEEFVKAGGGLLWIAGEHNVYVEKKGSPKTAGAPLPAKLAPPRSPEGTAVVLIIDKSSSMEGRKIELARLAAIGVVENLRPIDSVGVLIFDNSFQWAVPLRKADDRAGHQAPDRRHHARRRHADRARPHRSLPAILTVKAPLTNTSCCSPTASPKKATAMTSRKEAVANHVTISTVGLGQDVNRAFWRRWPTRRRQIVFSERPSGLEQILLRDVEGAHRLHGGGESRSRPKVVKQAEILDGVGMETAPPLRGYVRFQARPTADDDSGGR
jgi:Ca-activated chloride channel homolog